MYSDAAKTAILVEETANCEATNTPALTPAIKSIALIHCLGFITLKI